MRKLFLLFWALLATTCLWAHDFKVDGIYYNYLDDNNVAVTYKGSDYYSNKYSGEVTIPETVTYNGITYNVTSIGDYAFIWCSLTSITLPNNVTSIGEYAFAGCSKLTSITIPNSVTSIGDYAFDGCSLTSITIPNSVTSIGERAFGWCSLTSITIPNSVTNIGKAAFSSCENLATIIVEDGNSVYDSRDNCNAIIETATNILIAACQNTVIPNGVACIGLAAFATCRFTSITLPNSVTSIEDWAFWCCRSLTSITIPNSVTCIGEWAFSWCSKLTSLSIGSSVTNIGEKAFYKCSKLTSITCEATSPPVVGTDAFRKLSRKMPVIVPDESVDAYKSAPVWQDFNIQGKSTYIADKGKTKNHRR